MLSKAQVEQYREDGYVVAENVLDRSELATLRGKLQELLEGARGLTGHTEIYDLEPFHKPDDPRVRRIKTPHKFFPLFREFVQNPKLLRILQQLLAPAVRLHGSKINIKAPQGGAAVEWHQDWAFYPHTNDDVLAVGVMLDDCMMENGPLMILPGTHTGPVYDHHFEGYFAGAMDPTRYGLDLSRSVALTAPAGSMSFHHARVLHASAQNTSNRSRWLLLYEFTAADAWPLSGVSDLDEFNGRLLSGEPTLEPRLEKVPVRLPLPPALHQGSIYENQRAMKKAAVREPALAM
ncbi:MAG: phytanoyl-CoA dioxygenase [Rhodospirillales bacterium]|jgi:ectoine hydroxylase-related dioxygenase (phytanoyl-CoA dioxygenase family)|nr:phytanoyl-CoA dioxygenase [Rhodospirillales bacterium]